MRVSKVILASLGSTTRTLDHQTPTLSRAVKTARVITGRPLIVVDKAPPPRRWLSNRPVPKTSAKARSLTRALRLK